MSSPRPVLAAAAFLLILATLLPEPAAAQLRTLSWTQVSQVEMPGALGAFLRASGALDERRSEHAVHVFGRTLRQDDGSTSTILDAEGRRLLHVDHESRTYLEMTFEESAEMARGMMDVLDAARSEAEAAAEEARAERDQALEELRRSMDELEETMTFRVRTEATGERQSFGAFSAERHLLVAEVEAKEGVEGLEDAEGGALVFVVELWQSRDFPDLDAFFEDWARELADDPAMQALAADLAETLEPLSGEAGAELLVAWDPRIAVGVQKMAEAMESLEGTTVRSRTLVALVDPGATLDQAELLAWEPATMGETLRAGAADAARGAAQDAARGAIRGLSRGLMGRGGGDEEPEPEPRVRPLLRMNSAKENPLYTTTPATGENPLFQGLEAYRPISLADLMQGMGTPPG
jgi:hypothetical protein